IFAANLVAVQLARLDALYVRVPDEPVTLLQLDDVDRLATGCVEEQQENVGRLLRIHREVDAVRRERRPQRIVSAPGYGPLRSLLEFVCHFDLLDGCGPRIASRECGRATSRRMAFTRLRRHS